MADSKSQFLIASGVTLAAGAAVYGMSTSQKNKMQAEAAANERDIRKTAFPDAFQLPENAAFGTFVNKSGVVKIHTLCCKATTQPAKAMVVLVHGVGEHCQRLGYSRLYQALVKAGVDVYSMDHQGHGLSGGEHGYVEHFKDYIDDVEQYVRAILKGEEEEKEDQKQERPKLYLMGQSMGANIAAHVALRLMEQETDASDNFNSIAGLIFMSPMFGIDMGLVLQIQDFFGTALDKLVPRAKLVDAVRPEDMSRDKTEVERYINDPLIHHGNMGVHQALALKWGMTNLKAIRNGIYTPMIVMHGSSDPTTSLNATLDFFCNVNTPKERKRMVRLPDMKHELLNEFGREAIVDMVVDFVTNNTLPTGDKPRSEGADIEGVIELDFSNRSGS